MLIGHQSWGAPCESRQSWIHRGMGNWKEKTKTHWKKLNDNMLPVSQSTSSMQESLAQFADGQRHSKRPRVDELSDSDTNSNNDAYESDSDTLLKDGEKSNLSWES